MTKLKGIIFDLDSTLVNVNLDFNAIRAALGIPQPHPILEYLDTLDDHHHKTDLEKRLLTHELKAAASAKVINHVPEFLEFLKGKNIEMGILTRNCKEAALLELKDLAHFFNPIFSREDNQNCKPLPGGILATCEKWNLPPASTIMMGDYLFDIQAGKNAGAKTIWFNNPKYPDRDFSKEADYSLNSYEYFQNNFDHILERLGFKN